MVFNARPADFIFETEFQIAAGSCAVLTAALLYPIRSIAWYFHVLIASIAGLAILAVMLFALNELMG